MTNFKLTPIQKIDYQLNGYLIVKKFLSVKEVNKLYSIAIEDDTMKNHSLDFNDQ